jgi:hypothetical protein
MLELGKGDSGSGSSSATLVVGDVGGGICGPYFFAIYFFHCFGST